MREIQLATRIHASAERVWGELTDFEKYPGWNPFIRRIEGKLEIGARLNVEMRLDDESVIKFRPRLLMVQPNRELRWEGRALAPGVSTRHTFSILTLRPGDVNFIQHAGYDGLLASIVVGQMEDRLRLSFELMNRALRLRAERIPATAVGQTPRSRLAY